MLLLRRVTQQSSSFWKLAEHYMMGIRAKPHKTLNKNKAWLLSYKSVQKWWLYYKTCEWFWPRERTLIRQDFECSHDQIITALDVWISFKNYFLSTDLHWPLSFIWQGSTFLSKNATFWSIYHHFNISTTFFDIFHSTALIYPCLLRKLISLHFQSFQTLHTSRFDDRCAN